MIGIPSRPSVNLTEIINIFRKKESKNEKKSSLFF